MLVKTTVEKINIFIMSDLSMILILFISLLVFGMLITLNLLTSEDYDRNFYKLCFIELALIVMIVYKLLQYYHLVV